jgi:TRAP-type C4-dicarboxylate transport system permease small subunit
MGPEVDPNTARENASTQVSLKIEEVLIAAAMAAMALITVANVVTRYLTNISLAFTEEYSVVLMVIVTLLGTALATATNRHIRIGFFVDLLKSQHKRWFAVASAGFTALCFGLLAVFGGQLAYDEYRYEVLSSGLGHPNWWYTVWLPIMAIVVALRAIERLIRILRSASAS